MVLRGLAKAKNFSLGPTAPMKSFSEHIDSKIKTKELIKRFDKNHPLTDSFKNKKLYDYEIRTKKSFDDIVSTLKEIAYIQHNENFLKNALQISQKNLGIDLPKHILEKSWVKPLDMRALYAWCVFKNALQISQKI